MQEILSDVFDDDGFLDFAIDNFSEMMGYIAQGNLNIRIHRDILVRCGLGWIRYEMGFVKTYLRPFFLKQLIYFVSVTWT